MLTPENNSSHAHDDSENSAANSCCGRELDGKRDDEPRGTAGLAVLEARSQKHWTNWLQRKSLDGLCCLMAVADLESSSQRR
jgi:hypothetical protein